MSWVYLIVAGVLEVVWAFSMKQSHGFSRLAPSLITIIIMMSSFWLLAIAMRTIPLGTAYPIWTGIGAIGTFLVGVTLLAEPVNAVRIVAATLIVLGVVLMKVSST
ncbi:DMT family transporter [Modicisalibacter luteus]|uniref:Guanidinium exporter n=1 Tax=Modicisalibacter luteus TaxID=453962 RepID=A0ABV7LYZ5_9GAMM|nr:multidrug efflux SMR transporter [Halomonas lutea]GHB12837.1 QacE family quaternary ammonium compound efflux SMR transporter [Halomonas lutea]